MADRGRDSAEAARAVELVFVCAGAASLSAGPSAAAIASVRTATAAIPVVCKEGGVVPGRGLSEAGRGGDGRAATRAADAGRASLGGRGLPRTKEMTIATARNPPRRATPAQATLFRWEEPPPASSGETSGETRSAVGGSGTAGGTASGGSPGCGCTSELSETGGGYDLIRAFCRAQSTRVSRMKEGISSRAGEDSEAGFSGR